MSILPKVPPASLIGETLPLASATAVEMSKSYELCFFYSLTAYSVP